MNPEPGTPSGQTEITPVHVTEPLTIDAFAGQPPPSGLGQTETTGAILPPWTIGMTEPEATQGGE